jgi:flagellar biosynthesis protein FliR
VDQLPAFEGLASTAELTSDRTAGFVAVGTFPLAPGVSLLVRLALGWSLTIAAVPWVLSTAAPPPSSPSSPLTLLGELLIGGGLGLCVACLAAAAGWAGSVLGSVSGLAWADDHAASGPSEAATPLARLAWWLAAAAFLGCGGDRVVVGGLLDSFLVMPAGATAVQGLVAPLMSALAASFRLAVALAFPALLAVLCFHVTAAIVCRTAPLTPAWGLLQGLAACVLLAAIWTGGQAWARDIGPAMQAATERAFAGGAANAPRKLP